MLGAVIVICRIMRLPWRTNLRGFLRSKKTLASGAVRRSSSAAISLGLIVLPIGYHAMQLILCSMSQLLARRKEDGAAPA